MKKPLLHITMSTDVKRSAHSIMLRAEPEEVIRVLREKFKGRSTSNTRKPGATTAACEDPDHRVHDFW